MTVGDLGCCAVTRCSVTLANVSEEQQRSTDCRDWHRCCCHCEDDDVDYRLMTDRHQPDPAETQTTTTTTTQINNDEITTDDTGSGINDNFS